MYIKPGGNGVPLIAPLPVVGSGVLWSVYSVYLCVCLRPYLWHSLPEFHQIFYAYVIYMDVAQFRSGSVAMYVM